MCKTIFIEFTLFLLFFNYNKGCVSHTNAKSFSNPLTAPSSNYILSIEIKIVLKDSTLITALGFSLGESLLLYSDKYGSCGVDFFLWLQSWMCEQNLTGQSFVYSSEYLVRNDYLSQRLSKLIMSSGLKEALSVSSPHLKLKGM